MSDLIFILRTIVLTVVLVLLMQIKVGDTTIEQHSQAWMHESSAVEGLRTVADGAVKVISQVYRAIVVSLDTNIGRAFHKDQLPSQRLNIEPKRSAEYYLNEEAKKAAREAEEADVAQASAKAEAKK